MTATLTRGRHLPCAPNSSSLGGSGICGTRDSISPWTALDLRCPGTDTVSSSTYTTTTKTTTIRCARSGGTPTGPRRSGGWRGRPKGSDCALAHGVLSRVSIVYYPW
eukprot:scaffold67662_cov48-Phaeocystis_antarctica.AAC.3